MSRQKETARTQDGHFVNQRIFSKRVQVIDDAGENRGEMSRNEALTLAQEAHLDLVQVGLRGEVAIVKIMDFGKFIYEKKKQAGEAKKKQKVIQIKEIKMRPLIGIGDYNTKMNQAIKFLREGMHVKFTLRFRGRQPVSIQEVGSEFFERIKRDIVAQELGQLMEEKDTKAGPFWSKIFYIKD